ncbi:ABC transporter ATP-binding protein [Paenibacillus hamazuiensis]|uniref:ABC transporter ATP-binding protein n=1 Tax=Paenibacillus hamazuiensis TaxID=2936508 RepID=UPI0023DE7572|nr:ABC transporter ATP-binding protein [Paenibacillus hamazuiensis]
MSSASATAPAPEPRDKRKLLKRYFVFVKPYRYYLLAIISLGILQFIVPLAGPWMTKIMIDEVLPRKESYWTLGKVIAVLAGIQLFGMAANFTRNLVTSVMGNRMVHDTRTELYRHLQSLSQRYYDSRQIGSIVSRVINDVNGAQNLVNGGVINFAVDLFSVFFAGYMLFYLHGELALWGIVLLPLYYLTFTNMNVRIRFAWRAVHRQMERISGVLVERVAGMKIVQSFNREDTELARLEKQAKNHYDYVMSAQILSNLLGRISQSFNNAGSLIIWFVGGRLVMEGHMSTGELVAFQAYLSQMYNPIQRFSEVNVTIQNSLTNIERIFEVFDIEPDVKNKENALPLKQCKGDVEFRGVSFTYVSERPLSNIVSKNGDPDLVERIRPAKKFYLLPPKTATDPPQIVVEEREALLDISFHAKPGEVIALVGPSGAGKSTLINLVPRFYDPDEGAVLIDGIDIRDYDVRDLRKHIALVLQDNVLFSGTVYENIVYGNPDATPEQVYAAAKAANAHDFVMGWEQQYDTVLGERGIRLSGGQKQRIAIARALLKNPRFLILDEATSALDAESEALVTEALEKLMKGRTTIIIAHRLATITRADQILVMDRGRIAERGSHEELLKLGGLYRDLYEKQLKAMRPEELQKLLRTAN